MTFTFKQPYSAHDAAVNSAVTLRSTKKRHRHEQRHLPPRPRPRQRFKIFPIY
jgi:hypothetical protein